MENFTIRVWGLPESSKPRSTVKQKTVERADLGWKANWSCSPWNS